jgi:hypothetical protein
MTTTMTTVANKEISVVPVVASVTPVKSTRKPRRSKEVITAEKEAKAERMAEREAKKAVKDAEKTAIAERKAEREAKKAKKAAKPKMVHANGDEIKKNQTAYFLFQAANRDEVRALLAEQSNEKVKLGDVAKALGAMWKEYGEDEKRVYLDQAAADKARYWREVAANPENVVAPKKTNKTKKTKTVVIVVKMEPTEENDALTSVVEEHINTMEELARSESPVAGDKKKRKPNRPKEEIAAEKEVKAARKAEREAKKGPVNVVEEGRVDIIAELHEEQRTTVNN